MVLTLLCPPTGIVSGVLRVCLTQEEQFGFCQTRLRITLKGAEDLPHHEEPDEGAQYVIAPEPPFEEVF